MSDEQRDTWIWDERERMAEFKRRVERESYERAAEAVEVVAKNLFSWLTKLPIDSSQRVELSLRAGERQAAADEIRALAAIRHSATLGKAR